MCAFRSRASAPGKLILLGEHAVVYGRPAIAVAIDLGLTATVSESDVSRFDGIPLDSLVGSYVHSIVERHWDGPPLDIRVEGDLPTGSGLGSSAALTASIIRALHGDMPERALAEAAFEVELEVQGNASPVDTSTSTHGGGVLVSSKRGERHLWTISRDDTVWHVHDCEVPNLDLVIGNTGIQAPTGPLVAHVRSLFEDERWAREAIDEIGAITMQGVDALRERDLPRLGRLMNRDHEILRTLGVSCDELDSLVDAVSGHCHGAKLTGAGGGGCMVCLTDEPSRVIDIMGEMGATPYAVRTGVGGAALKCF